MIPVFKSIVLSSSTIGSTVGPDDLGLFVGICIEEAICRFFTYKIMWLLDQWISNYVKQIHSFSRFGYTTGIFSLVLHSSTDSTTVGADYLGLFIGICKDVTIGEILMNKILRLLKN